MAETIMHHGVRHIGEWLMYGSGKSDLREMWSETTADYDGEARRYVSELIRENRYVYFDFSEFRDSPLKWIALGNEQYVCVKYGPSESSPSVKSDNLCCDDHPSLRRGSATLKYLKALTGYSTCKLYEFKDGKLV